MAETSIQWTDHSINPIRARLKSDPRKAGHYCEKVSPGCANCYSSNMQKRFGTPAFGGASGVQLNAVDLFLDESKLHEVLKKKEPTKYFWCSMTDLFGKWVPDAWIDRCFATMALTPQHTHLVLTKRPERMKEYLLNGGDDDGLLMRWGETAGLFLDGNWIWGAGKKLRPQIERFISVSHREYYDEEPELSDAEKAMSAVLPNVWCGTSVEDQQTAEERIPHLLQVPAKVRFLSVEPMIGPINLQRLTVPRVYGSYLLNALTGKETTHLGHSFGAASGKIDWLICGGESGPKARPFRLEWARSLRDQCKDAGVAFFYKQGGTSNKCQHDSKGGCFDCFPEDMRVREMPGETP